MEPRVHRTCWHRTWTRAFGSTWQNLLERGRRLTVPGLRPKLGCPRASPLPLGADSTCHSPGSAPNAQDRQKPEPLPGAPVQILAAPRSRAESAAPLNLHCGWKRARNMTTGPWGKVWEWEEGFLPQESWGALVRKSSRGWVANPLHEGRRRKRWLAASPRSTSWLGVQGWPTCQRTGTGSHVDKQRRARETRALGAQRMRAVRQPQ